MATTGRQKRGSAPSIAPSSAGDQVDDRERDVWVRPGKRGENLRAFDFPTYALGRLTGIIRRSFMSAYVEPFALTIPEWRVMVAVAERSSLSFNEICETITMDRAQVSRTLSGMLAKGYVAQLTKARAKRRGRGHNLTQTKLILTPEGRRLYRRILPIAQRHQMILLSALDEPERAIVHAALGKMITAAERFEAQRTAKPARTGRGVAATRARKSSARSARGRTVSGADSRATAGF